MNLLIVESPGKVKKIQGFLGENFKVMASVGHVRDLPQKEIGVAAPDFTPRYAPTERGREVLAKLTAAVKEAETVYLATDPDREGEAIAWHLAEALKLKDPLRVTYTELTEAAVKKALEHPRKIDLNLVKAQEGRRVLDRL
ncbi:MAG: toprim domain-containing protein, partial [Candidatus Adiutrix sp.]|nr:toprim domain-containing protein [Candidatus Adiutrix sp.]